MLIGGAGVVNGHADMIMLGWFGEPEEVGVYRVAVQGAALVAFGLHAVNPIIAPEFSRLYAQSNIKQLQRVVTASARAILVAALPVVLLFTLYGTAIVSWVFGSEYTDADMPLVILSVAQLINAGYGSVGLLMTMTGHENDAARTMWTTASINIVLNAILIPWLGMNGAALASAISLIVWNAVLFRKVRTNLNISSTAFGRVHD
jgi:O-antigen/teichoic acid export membrane protein